ncbi:Zinc finger protein 84 [Frankliniella fusca]|uniref:Zinc finger protein 84 n=1 Tax=Frankliniella fusca TaxID=407009 RepID=A0AAE1HX98_9NEOP|nr:Zinc finger protein 84 [Frankliniella fusca]
MTGDINPDRPRSRTHNLQVYVCSVCGGDHETIDCSIVQNLKVVHDTQIQSRARQTLPKDFIVKSLADGSTTVITNVRIDQGTQFGPFQAPLSIDLPPAVSFPLKVFGKTLDEGYFLDTTDEECCNWMCLVASASNSKEQNLICYDVKQSIFFATTRDVEPGQELRLWYALYYGLKLQALPLCVEAIGEGDFLDSVEEVQERANDGNNIFGKASPKTLTQHLPAHALGASGQTEEWVCKLCGAQESNVASYARHLMTHYRQPVDNIQHSQCSFCFRVFLSKAVLEKHVLKHHISHIHKSKTDSLETDNSTCIKSIERPRLDKICLWDSNKINEPEIKLSDKISDESQVLSLEHFKSDTDTQFDETKLNSSCEKQLMQDPNERDGGHTACARKTSHKYNRPGDQNFIQKLKIDKEHDINPLPSSQDSEREKLVAHSTDGDSFSTSFKLSSSQAIDVALENGEPVTFIMVQSTENNLSSTEGDNVERHQEKSENENLHYNCDICQKSFTRGAYLYRHLRKHTGEFTCVTCLAVFARKENLKTHSCIKPKESFPCSMCGRKFSAKKYLQRHIPLHTGEFACSECNRHFVSKLSLKYHRCNCDKNQSRSGSISCAMCERTFSSESKLKAHLRIHYDLKSKPGPFKSSQNIHRQARKKDVNTKSKKNKIPEGKLFICEICGAIFKSSSSMKTHWFCHGERKFECSICEKRFHRKDVLQEHSRVHEEANFPCEVCGKKYKTKKSLYVHSLIHGGSKRFSCSVCAKSFFQKGNLLKHAQTHTSSRMYCCQYCKKSFSSKEYFSIHQLTHTQGKIYRCDECNRGFVKKHLLDTHRQSFHSNRGFLCKFCNNIVRHRHSIRRHLQKSHGSLRNEWSIPGFIDCLQVELPLNLTTCLGDAKLTPKEQQERSNQIEILRRKHFQNKMFFSLDSTSEFTFASPPVPQLDQFSLDDPVEMLKPSHQLTLLNNFPAGNEADKFQAASQLDMASENVEDAENEVVFTLVNEESSHYNSSNVAPFLSSTSLESSITDFDSGTTFLMENGHHIDSILLYVVEAHHGEDCNSEDVNMAQ